MSNTYPFDKYQSGQQWEVVRRVEGEDCEGEPKYVDEWLATVDTEALADLLVAALKRREDEDVRVTEYVRKRGVVCPHCGSDKVESDAISIDDQPTASCRCRCGATWTDVYELAGYEDLTVPNEESPADPSPGADRAS